MATRIELDAEPRSALWRRAASLTLPYRVVVRAKLVLLAPEGHTNREIAERVPCRLTASAIDEGASKEPYARARRGFWIVDYGSDHRGQRSIERRPQRVRDTARRAGAR